MKHSGKPVPALRRYAFWRLLVVLALGLLAASSSAQPPDAGPQPGVLLLRNGQVLEGMITWAQDRFHVALTTGEVRVKADEVEAYCRDLEEGYYLKRAAARPSTAADHLNLANWCLQHRLLGHAADELRQAMALEPHHPKNELLRRKLNLALQRPSAPAEPQEALESFPSGDDLDRLVLGMPAGAVETFTQAIQPLLVNGCTATACHGPGSESKHRFVRIPVSRPSSLRITQRNLHTAMQMIDRENPLASPLLAAASQPHGTAQTPVFTDRQAAQFQHLVAWVQQVAQTKEIAQAPRVETPPPLLQTLPWAQLPRPQLQQPQPGSPGSAHEGADERLGPAVPAPADAPNAIPPPGSFTGGPSAELRAESGGAQLGGGAVLGFVPRDPFDPAIFNRRFFPDRPQAPAHHPAAAVARPGLN